ncbi:DNA replication/repair protein RecF [Paracoccus pacificus]|uniref:DNA replication and repair protein RecF n=1 Tax=Paracoccus pacificus TaxID=1463598 RepID=A0ABW4R6Y7_9RHOB
MTLTHLRLSQFRSWESLRLELDSRPMAIYGANGSGKTNILESLSMLAPGRGLRGASAADQARQGVGAGWRIRARVDDHDIATGAADGGVREVTLDEKPSTQVALGDVLRVIWLVPAMDRLWTEAPEGRRRFLDRLTLSFIPGHAEDSLAYDRAMRERNRLLRDQVQDPAWYRALESQMADAGAAITRHRLDAIDLIARAQADGMTQFPAATLTLLPGEGFADDPAPDSIAERLARFRSRDMGAGRSLTGPHRADLGAHWGPQEMPAALSSTGEQKALLLSLILANARALASEIPVLLLDEVAAHLDGDRRAMLYDEIAALSAQAFLTGTGPELFDSLSDRARMVEIRREDAVSAATERTP